MIRHLTQTYTCTSSFAPSIVTLCICHLAFRPPWCMPSIFGACPFAPSPPRRVLPRPAQVPAPPRLGQPGQTGERRMFSNWQTATAGCHLLPAPTTDHRRRRRCLRRRRRFLRLRLRRRRRRGVFGDPGAARDRRASMRALAGRSRGLAVAKYHGDVGWHTPCGRRLLIGGLLALGVVLGSRARRELGAHGRSLTCGG